MENNNIDEKLERLNTDLIVPWTIREGSLYKSFVFEDFLQAFNFMGRVALIAEQLQHHPDWSNSYNRVNISLVTHESNCITDRDFELAHEIEQL